MTDFKDFYTIDQLSGYKDAHAAYMVNQSAKTAEQDAKVSIWLKELEVFETSLDRFIRHKGKSGELAEIPFVADRRLRWADRWNRMVSGTETEWDLKESLLQGAGLLVMSLTVSPRKDQPEKGLAQMYDELVGKINDGEHVEPNSVYGSCDLTAQTLYMQMASGWKPRYGRFGKDHEFLPLQDEAPKLAVQHNTIPVPSGEVLISDWFRVEGFREAMEHKGLPCVTTLAGRLATSAHLASQGVMSVWVGNSSPSVVVRDGQIVVASSAYDEDLVDNVALPGQHAGRVCTDLWCASAVDREVLTQIVARSAGREVAEQRVAEFLEEYADTVVTVQLPPNSTLHVYHLDHGLEGFECDVVDATGTDPLYLVASLSELEWRPTAAAKQKARP